MEGYRSADSCRAQDPLAQPTISVAHRAFARGMTAPFEARTRPNKRGHTRCDKRAPVRRLPCDTGLGTPLSMLETILRSGSDRQSLRATQYRLSKYRQKSTERVALCSGEYVHQRETGQKSVLPRQSSGADDARLFLVLPRPSPAIDHPRQNVARGLPGLISEASRLIDRPWSAHEHTEHRSHLVRKRDTGQRPGIKTRLRDGLQCRA